MATLQVIDRDGVSHDVECKSGLKVMEVLRELDYGVAAICGGMCSCATCHIYIDPAWAEKLPAPMSDERDLLTELSHYRENSRLSCQVEITPALVGAESHHRRRRVAICLVPPTGCTCSPSSAASSLCGGSGRTSTSCVSARTIPGTRASSISCASAARILSSRTTWIFSSLFPRAKPRTKWPRRLTTEGFKTDVIDTPESGELALQPARAEVTASHGARHAGSEPAPDRYGDRQGRPVRRLERETGADRRQPDSLSPELATSSFPSAS